MFDQIVKLSIKNRWLVLIVFLFIGAFGVYNYFKLPIDAVPDITATRTAGTGADRAGVSLW